MSWLAIIKKGWEFILALLALLRAKQVENRIRAVEDKKETDDEVENLAPADLDSRFDRWRMRDK